MIDKNQRSKLMTHKEHSEKVKPSIPCAAWHITFGGNCLNCGYDSNQKQEPIRYHYALDGNDRPYIVYD